MVILQWEWLKVMLALLLGIKQPLLLTYSPELNWKPPHVQGTLGESKFEKISNKQTCLALVIVDVFGLLGDMFGRKIQMHNTALQICIGLGRGT